MVSALHLVLLQYWQSMNLYELLGILSIIWLWSSFFILTRLWPGNISMTFSEHAAQTRGSIVYYFLTFSVFLISFYVFIIRWFVPTFQLSKLFSVFMTLASLGEFVALIVPTTGGIKTRIHDCASFCMLGLLVPLSGLIAVSPHFPMFIRVFASLVAPGMIFICLLFTFDKRTLHYKLIAQIVYGGSFHLLVLIAIFSH